MQTQAKPAVDDFKESSRQFLRTVFDVDRWESELAPPPAGAAQHAVTASSTGQAVRLFLTLVSTRGWTPCVHTLCDIVPALAGPCCAAPPAPPGCQKLKVL